MLIMCPDYSPTLFKTMGLDYNMQLIMSGVVNICQLVGVTSSIWTMDAFGRRPLLLSGSMIMCLSHLIIAVLVGKFSNNWPAHRAEGWASVAMLLVYMVAFGTSWGPVPWAMPSEIFPSSLRAKGVALSTCSNWLNNFIIGLITPPLVENTGFGAYTFFAVFCLLSFVWTVCCCTFISFYPLLTYRSTSLSLRLVDGLWNRWTMCLRT